LAVHDFRVNVAEKNRAVESRLVQVNFATATRYTIRGEPNFRVVSDVYSPFVTRKPLLKETLQVSTYKGT
jgi:hypothetical protein